MGRAPCCSKVGLLRGPWTAREDELLISYIQANGEGHWRSLPKKAGLLRCGKSCRLRWMNYLRPDIKRGNITPDEDDLIIRLHSLLGNRWSLIAGRLPGRTDNEIKNYWNSHLSKRVKNDNNNGTNQKCTRKRSSTNKKSGKKKQKIDNQDGVNKETTEKIKIHLPKAVRISPASVTRNMSVYSVVSTTGSSSDDHAGVAGDDYTKVLNLPRCGSDFKPVNSDGEAWASIEDLDFVYDHHHDPSCQNAVPTNDSMLDDVFEEYEQLLKSENHAQLDFFVDSLLA